MTPETITLAASGAGIAVASAYNAWQSVMAKREARAARAHAQEAAEHSLPVSNGFTRRTAESLDAILSMATEARDAATRAEGKVDRHLEAHANSQLAPALQAVRMLP